MNIFLHVCHQGGPGTSQKCRIAYIEEGMSVGWSVYPWIKLKKKIGRKDASISWPNLFSSSFLSIFNFFFSISSLSTFFFLCSFFPNLFSHDLFFSLLIFSSLFFFLFPFFVSLFPFFPSFTFSLFPFFYLIYILFQLWFFIALHKLYIKTIILTNL